MSREDDLREEMARIKASERYKKHQEENVPKIVASKALNTEEPIWVGKTIDGREDIFIPTVGPDAAKVAHLRRSAWVCNGCKQTMVLRRGRTTSGVVIGLDGKVYHSYCCKPNLKRTGKLEEHKEGEKDEKKDE